jgi:hypothetical protein
LHALWQFERESLVRKVAGVSEEAARYSPVGSGTTLFWLMRHITFAERLWVIGRFAGETVTLPDEDADDVSLADAIEEYERTWAEVDSVVLSASSLDELCRDAPEGPATNLRWVVGHLLEETARHAGHADILRELIDGDTGR